MFNPGLGSFKPSPGVVSPVMTTPPRVSQQDALKHVLDHILCLSNHSGIRLSLKASGYVKLCQVIGMPASSMSALSYKAKVGGVVATIRLFSAEEDTLRALQGFARFKAAHLGRILTPGDWLKLNEIMFNAYFKASFQRHCGSHGFCHDPNRNQHSLPVPTKEGRTWGAWQQNRHIPSAQRVVQNTPTNVGSGQPVSNVPVHDSYLDSNMGRGPDDVDHPAMMSSPNVLVPAPRAQAHEAYLASNMGRCHGDVNHLAMMSLPQGIWGEVMMMLITQL